MYQPLRKYEDRNNNILKNEGQQELVALTYRDADTGEQTPILANRIVYTEGNRKYIKHIGKKVYLVLDGKSYPKATVRR
jgi:hypothetical protein